MIKSMDEVRLERKLGEAQALLDTLPPQAVANLCAQRLVMLANHQAQQGTSSAFGAGLSFHLEASNGPQTFAFGSVFAFSGPGAHIMRAMLEGLMGSVVMLNGGQPEEAASQDEDGVKKL